MLRGLTTVQSVSKTATWSYQQERLLTSSINTTNLQGLSANVLMAVIQTDTYVEQMAFSAHMQTAGDILRVSFPTVGALEDTLLENQQLIQIPPTGPYPQFLHIRGNH